jgi:predicted nuclease of predicted toxin-antitoxin system
MRFLANENFPRAAVEALEKAGHDVTWVRVAAPGASDSDVLSKAAHEGRILLTFDKDFGEFARAAALPATCVFRCPDRAMSDTGSPKR